MHREFVLPFVTRGDEKLRSSNEISELVKWFPQQLSFFSYLKTKKKIAITAQLFCRLVMEISFI